LIKSEEVKKLIGGGEGKFRNPLGSLGKLVVRNLLDFLTIGLRNWVFGLNSSTSWFFRVQKNPKG